jgi:hypothetical protein
MPETKDGADGRPGDKRKEDGTSVVGEINGLREYIGNLDLPKHQTAKINVVLSVVTIIFTIATTGLSIFTKLKTDEISESVSLYHEVLSTRQFDRGLMISLFDKASAIVKEKNAESMQVFSVMIGSFIQSYDLDKTVGSARGNNQLEISVERDRAIMRNYIASISDLLQKSGVANPATVSGSIELQARLDTASDAGGAASTAAQADIKPRTVPGDPAGWDYDVFWCETSPQAARQAETVFDYLVSRQATDHLGRLRLRPLAATINNGDGYHVGPYVIRRHITKNGQANILKQELDEKFAPGFVFRIEDSAQLFPFYLSIFVCP